MTKEKPKICAIDLDINIVKAIESNDLHCFSGTLGNRIKVTNFPNQPTYLSVIHENLPSNLQEYDIIIIDLKNREPIEYCKSDYEEYVSTYTTDERYDFLSSYPNQIFDPRPYSSSFLKDRLKECKEILIIVFCYPDLDINYTYNKITSSPSPLKIQTRYSLYEFLPFFKRYENKNPDKSLGKPKQGKQVNLSSLNSDFRSLSLTLTNIISRYTRDFKYYFTFDHPSESDDNKGQKLKRDSFVPLLCNDQQEIIGFFDIPKKIKTLALPQLTDEDKKKDLIIELLNNDLPEIFHDLTQFLWLKSEPYFVPNHTKLVKDKEDIEKEYKHKLQEIKRKIEDNEKKYKFLHNLITETGDALVKSVEEFLKYLGFTNMTNMDETNPKIKEEDLQIDLEDGLLIIEIKGIGGTSKDQDLLQISKIKKRREEEMHNSSHVYALYIVNHQRFLPPEKRKNPPFYDRQIKDASSHKCGLLSTYELFKLYFKIEEGYIIKEDVRKSLLNDALIKFEPSNAECLGKPSEIHHNNTVAILNIKGITIKDNKRSSIIVCNDNDWFETKVLTIKLNDEKVHVISDGEIGIKLDKQITKNSVLWLKK